MEEIKLTETLKEKLYNRYKKENNPGMFFACTFGIPFGLGCVGMMIGAIAFLLNEEIVAGLMFLLLGSPIFGLVAYFVGFGMHFHYFACLKNIKNEKYQLERTVCIANSVTKESRYSDIPDMEDYCKMVFKNENGKFGVTKWGRVDSIVPGKEYLLVFLKSGKRPTGRVDYICDEANETIFFS